MNAGFIRNILILGVTAVALAACAETQLVVHTAKRVQEDDKAEPAGTYKVGNPYQIAGTWYYPHIDYDYDETGIASWYGDKFHGRATANGEKFDMNALSAAHRTLPLPSFVEVTNLENGRQLKLRVNDRGPFAKGRIIDISRRGAQLLGFEQQGTAKVRVRILAEESRIIASKLRGGSRVLAKNESPIVVDKLPKSSVTAESLTPPDGAEAAPSDGSGGAVPSAETEVASRELAASAESETDGSWATSLDGTVEHVAPKDTRIFVQAGAFTQYENANRAQALLASIGDVEISQALVGDKDFYRVRLGPVASVPDADLLLQSVMDAGYSNARIVVD